ncbi:hypothetical protein SPRG_10291 [Saprolegnia parasitica CBS 223.65]|uniref:Uncharacterized protein n=1 Tax=Saprolegnia parasitica (strain CBS 223.65) TaxID=695850 RepID=A0A067C5P8_SAPPC|nr:hypothetical protein SPRG_10291 [Saprolegnia parasitica CBS 223.65]KDO24475.1 hypothetical protein SPRG_10291 [Saprolegnia parasitica CBS 223.65]|eukprot:XP_012204741.1 hypothetical protein SPRG_10291 [Saprolegnia parasitica CBS 223.65]
MTTHYEADDVSDSDDSQTTPETRPHGRKRQRDLQLVTTLASEAMTLETTLWKMRHAVSEKMEAATAWERSARLEAIGRHTLEVQRRNLHQTVVAHCKAIHSLQSHLLKSATLSSIPMKRPRRHYFSPSPLPAIERDDTIIDASKPHGAVKIASLTSEAKELVSMRCQLIQRLDQKARDASPWELSARQETLDMHSALVENRNLKACLEEYMKYLTALRFMVLKCPLATDEALTTTTM